MTDHRRDKASRAVNGNLHSAVGYAVWGPQSGFWPFFVIDMRIAFSPACLSDALQLCS